MNDLQKPGYYIRTYDRDIYITEQQKTVLFSAMDSDKNYFSINDSRIMMSQVKEVVPSSEYQKNNKYVCPKHPDNYVPKGKVCGYC